MAKFEEKGSKTDLKSIYKDSAGAFDDASKGLRVPLDKASSGDLLFMKKKDPISTYLP